MFSCLISIYYKETPDFLQECLQSILDQTFVVQELIIVKDGPLTDSLELILKRYSELFKKNGTLWCTVSLDKNVGLGNALNEGVKYCSSEYIMRMDSDDIMKPDRVEIMTELVSNNPELDVIGSQIEEFDSDTKKILGIRRVPLDSNYIKDTFKYRNPMNHVSTVMKKSSLIEIGGYPNFLFFEDYALWTKMISSKYKFHNSEKILVSVRAGSDMIGRRHGLFYAKQEIKMQKLLLKSGLTNFFWFLFNVLFRGLGRLAPKSLLQLGIKFYRDK